MTLSVLKSWHRSEKMKVRYLSNGENTNHVVALIQNETTRRYGLFFDGMLVTDCVYDYVEIDEYHEGPALVHLYDGINYYTSDIRQEDIRPVINGAYSERQLKLLEEKPYLFGQLSRAYFVDKDGAFNETGVLALSGAAKKGVKIKKNALAESRVSKEEIEEKMGRVLNAIDEKIETEKSAVGKKSKSIKSFDFRNL